MPESQVKNILLKQGKYVSGKLDEVKWAFQVHGHHFYPKWLLGKADGVTIPVRGIEHISDLEPALLRHMKFHINKITSKNTEHIKFLIQFGVVKQDEITEALVQFYKQRYIGLDEKIIREALEKSVNKLD